MIKTTRARRGGWSLPSDLSHRPQHPHPAATTPPPPPQLLLLLLLLLLLHLPLLLASPAKSSPGREWRRAQIMDVKADGRVGKSTPAVGYTEEQMDEQQQQQQQATRLKVASREVVALVNEEQGWVLAARGAALEARKCHPDGPQPPGSMATLYRYKSSNPTDGCDFVSLGFGQKMLCVGPPAEHPTVTLKERESPETVSSLDKESWRCVFLRRGRRHGTELESAAFRGSFLSVPNYGAVGLQPRVAGSVAVESDSNPCLFNFVAAVRR
ncbi:uncharacterized protein LOC133357515 [Lethenteron reissneri]|uniref:uncharacterized protein LOC133357515 n=1 Tax=Lethenteron reissneri TaxID=7753 RepID=UPI002AB7A159|nr:uncharacterized protein LOC133357515 [Lethenteron reissneri]XP_061431466.1 uncharacterized protein LOC133357515 [Lethenteron reissneri]